jgi:hypothetical protein
LGAISFEKGFKWYFSNLHFCGDGSWHLNDEWQPGFGSDFYGNPILVVFGDQHLQKKQTLDISFF